MLPWESICVILMGQGGLSPFRPADYRFSSCESRPTNSAIRFRSAVARTILRVVSLRCFFFCFRKACLLLFIIINSMESIAKKKLKKKTVLPRRVIPSPGIEAYNDSARTCAAFEYSCQ